MENLNNMMMGIKKSVDNVSRSMEALKNKNHNYQKRGSVTSKADKSSFNRLADTPVNVPSPAPTPPPQQQ